MGPGHFLSHRQTLELMESEYLYPKVADRASIEDWEQEGLPGYSPTCPDTSSRDLVIPLPNLHRTVNGSRKYEKYFLFDWLREDMRQGNRPMVRRSVTSCDCMTAKFESTISAPTVGI